MAIFFLNENKVSMSANTYVISISLQESNRTEKDRQVMVKLRINNSTFSSKTSLANMCLMVNQITLLLFLQFLLTIEKSTGAVRIHHSIVSMTILLLFII